MILYLNYNYIYVNNKFVYEHYNLLYNLIKNLNINIVNFLNVLIFE